MGVGGLEILPILLAEVAEVVGGHGVPAEVGHGLEVWVERWLSEFGWDDFVTPSLAWLRLANLHWDVRKGNLYCSWSRDLLVAMIVFVEIAPVRHVKVDARVDVGRVLVDVIRADERVTVPGLTVASSRVSATSSVGVGRRDGVLSLKSMRELVVNAVSGLLGRGQT